MCRIACGNIPPSPVDRLTDGGGSDSDSLSSLSTSGDDSSKSSKPGFWSRMSFRNLSPRPASTPVGAGSGGTTPTGSAGAGGSRYGLTVSLCGCISDIAVFAEPLLDTHVQAIYRLG